MPTRLLLLADTHLPKRAKDLPAAVWQAVERACITGDFRPRPSSLCATCPYQRWCPSFGGDPDRAASEAPLVLAPALAAT